MAFTETFGGTTIYPSDVSYRAISLSANQELSWPLEVATSGNVVAQIMDVTPSAGGFTITMPPANEASPGETALFFNAGAHNFTVADNAGNTIVAITPGLAYQVYLTTNTTVAGTWRTTQFGAGTSSATAGSLVGAGIKAINTTLNQSMAVTSLAVNYTAGAADRSAAFLWTGGAGTITLPAASTVGNDWFFHIRNGGTGAISLATTGGELINGTATVDFNPGDSAIIVCDGTGYFTIGFGQAPEFLFDYVSIDLTGQSSPYTLAGSNLNRIAYQFSGTLTTNMQIIVPATIQQYWVGNFTTGGSYTLTVKTSAGTGVVVPRDARAILYCNGTDVVTADTGGISIPILVSQGGTGATNASSARTNLGATSIGNALFIAVDEATARNAIIAAKSGANSDITSLTGLTTPLSVAQGGTGVATFTANGLVYGAGTSSLSVTAAGTTGQVLVGNTGAAPSWATLSGIGVTTFSAGTTGLTPSSATSGAITLSGTLVVANGGTGQSSYTNGQLLIGNSTGNTLTKATLTAGTNVSITNGAGSITINATDQFTGTVTSVAASGGTTGLTFSGSPITTSGTLTLGGTLVVANGGTGATTLTGYVKGSGTSALTASATIPATDISGGAALTKTDDTNVTLTLGGTPASALLAATSLTLGWSGQLSVARGGTGASTLTANGVLYGAGTSAIAATAVGTTGQVLVGNTGAAPSWATLTGIGVTSFSGGTTGLTPSTATTGAITLAGTLGVANGGTGATTLSSGYLVKGNGTSAVSASVVYDTGTNVGIGTASPGTKLDVVGTINASDGTNGNIRAYVDGTTAYLQSLNQAANAYRPLLAMGSTVSFANNGVTNMTLDASGNLGLNCTATALASYRGIELAGAATTQGGFLRMRTSDSSVNSLDFLDTNGRAIFTTTAHPVRFGTSDTERMRIDSSGNVGIGISTPVAYAGYGNLTVNGTSGGTLTLRNSANTNSSEMATTATEVYLKSVSSTPLWFGTNNTEKMRIDASGNVGIGTSSITPIFGRTLQISDGTVNSSISLLGTGAGTTGDGYLAATADAFSITARASTFLTLGTNDTERMRIDSSGNVGIGTQGPSSYGKLAVIGNIATSTDGGTVLSMRANAGATTLGAFNSTGSFLSFNTNASGSGEVERMRIDSSGNVGIGTTSPNARLHVNGAAARLLVDFSGDNYYDAATHYFRNYASTATSYISVGTSSTLFSTNTTLPLILGTNNTERMRIDASGNVGIGTSSPTVRADILGVGVGNSAVQPLLQLRSASDALGNSVEMLLTPIISGQTRTAIGGVREGATANAAIYMATNNTERMRIDASGNLLVGTTSTTMGQTGIIMTPAVGGNVGNIDIGHSSAAGGGNAYLRFFYNAGVIGSVTQDGTTGVLYNTSSDARLKDNITDADDAASLIDAIQVRKFDWKSDGSHQRYGFVAQELVTVAPEAVSQPEDPEEMMGVDYSKLVPMLVKEIQSLRARVAQLEGN